MVTPLAASCVVALGVLVPSAVSAGPAVWRGTVNISTALQDTDTFGNSESYTYTARAVFPGRAYPGFNRSRWHGTLAYSFSGTEVRVLLDGSCRWTASDSYPVEADIYRGGGEGDPARLAVSIYFSPASRSWGKAVTAECTGYDIPRSSRPEEILPVVESAEFVLPPKTRTFARSLRLKVRGGIQGLEGRATVRISFALR